MSWSIAGHFSENCSCDLVCPCELTPLQGPATNDRCLVSLCYRIGEGVSNGVDLSGLSFIWICDSPPFMSQGGFKYGTYIDAAADPQQREELTAIVHGQRGGMPEAIHGFFGPDMGTKFVPIEYEYDRATAKISVPDLLSVELTAATVLDTGAPLVLGNSKHFMGKEMPLARADEAWVKDDEMTFEWDNRGKAGHMMAFEWASE
jgi:hypothetical protein